MLTAEKNRDLLAGETARMIGVHYLTLYRWGSDGRGPRFRVVGTRQRRYRLTDVQAWIDSRPTGGEGAGHGST